MSLDKEARKLSEEKWLRDYERAQGKAINDSTYRLPGQKRTKHHGNQ